MKILVLFVGLFSMNTFAFPTVGDVLTYKLTFTQDSDGAVVVEDTCTIEFKSHDDVKQRWNAHSTCVLNGGEGSRDIIYWDDNQDLNMDHAEQIVASCEANGHVKEVIATPKGDVEACKVYTPGNQVTSWIAKLPLNAAKVVAPGFWGKTLTTELIDFKITE